MVLLNKMGVILYHVGLLTVIAILALSLKNFDFENPANTAEYSQNLDSLIYLAVGVLISLAALITLTTLIAGARKKGIGYGALLIVFWVFVTFCAVFAYASSIFKYVDEPVYKYGFTALGAVLSFFPMLTLILMQHPGSAETDKLVMALKKELQEEANQSLPFCPECKTRVKKTFKYCPNCGTRFSD